MLGYYEELVSGIAAELHASVAAQRIAVRPFLHAIRDHVEAKGDYAVITTNWDFLLEDVFTDIHVAHIHGDID
jgi:NAD-dependent SIR2 family protein deacetylase